MWHLQCGFEFNSSTSIRLAWFAQTNPQFASMASHVLYNARQNNNIRIFDALSILSHVIICSSCIPQLSYSACIQPWTPKFIHEMDEESLLSQACIAGCTDDVWQDNDICCNCPKDHRSPKGSRNHNSAHQPAWPWNFIHHPYRMGCNHGNAFACDSLCYLARLWLQKVGRTWRGARSVNKARRRLSQ